MQQYGVDKAIQEHLNHAQTIPGLVAALVCFGPHSGSDRYTYLRSGSPERILEQVNDLAVMLESQGCASETCVEFSAGGSDYLAISTYNGNPAIAPFIVAAVEVGPDFDRASSLQALQRVLYSCVGESYSIKWK